MARRSRSRSLLGAAFLGLFGTIAEADSLTVFAAASLQPVLVEIAENWPDADVVVAAAGSGTLARQVAAGAPADIVVLANTAWMDWLDGRGVLEQSPVSVAGNGLVLIGTTADTLDLNADAIEGLLGADGLLAMGDIRAVPAGIYGAQSLQNLDLWSVVAPRLAQADNVRSALAFVARGEAPLGVVYATDARADPRVFVKAQLPVTSHDPILYPAAPIKGAPQSAALFVEHLQTKSAQAIFKAYGFVVPVQ